FDDVTVVMQGGLGQVPRDPPEYAGQYPDPNLWGETPASGFFLRHVDGLTFSRSTIDVQAPDARPLFRSDDVSNLILAQSDVTFPLRVDVGSPPFDPTLDQLRIVGRTIDPYGAGAPDPLGGWRSSGIDLTRTQSDPTGRWRYAGSAALPQGATIEFKA